MFENFGDIIKNVLSISDDTIVYGFEAGSDHDATLTELERAREKNWKFNPDKLRIQASEIPFFRHIISKDDIKPDPKKVEVIAHMNPPEGKKQVFWG